MTVDLDASFRINRIAPPGRGAGEIAIMDFGPADRPVDLVFLHANGFNARTYRHILGPMGARFRVLAFDQRGHGATSLATETSGRRDWLDLRDDLMALLRSLDLHDVVLSGHSMGATACLLAAAATSRVRHLVLFDPVIIPRPMVEGAPDSPMVLGALRRRARFASREEALAAYRGRGAFRTWPNEILIDYLAAGLKATPEGDLTLACAPTWEASNYAVHGHDSWAALRETTIPIDILTAETGSTFRRVGAPDLATFAPRVRVETVAGSTHFLPMERPELVRAALTAAVLGGSAFASEPLTGS
jgi:pimeloyl-ACP methyl ester carboxylesterase